MCPKDTDTLPEKCKLLTPEKFKSKLLAPSWTWTEMDGWTRVTLYALSTILQMAGHKNIQHHMSVCMNWAVLNIQWNYEKFNPYPAVHNLLGCEVHHLSLLHAKIYDSMDWLFHLNCLHKRECIFNVHPKFLLRHSTFTILWTYSAVDILMIFCLFFQENRLTIHANCLLRRQFAWNVSLFSEENKGDTSNCRLLIFFLIVLGLTTRQPLRVILCRLPEKGRKEIEERVEEMKEGQGRKRNRNESEETEEIKTFPLYPYPLQG